MSHLTLFDLTQTISDLVDDLVDAHIAGDTEEIQALFEELDSLYGARSEKHVGYIHVIKNAESAAENCKAEASLFAKRANALKNLASRLKETLRMDLREHGEKSTTAGNFKIARQNGAPRVVVRIDPESLPDDFQRITIEADKSALKDALKRGESVDGVELEISEHVRIRLK